MTDDDSDLPIYYDYIERKEERKQETLNTQKMKKETTDSEEESDSVVILTSIKIPNNNASSKAQFIQICDQGNTIESEQETDLSQTIDTESSECPKLLTPPFSSKIANNTPYSLTNEYLSQEQSQPTKPETKFIDDFNERNAAQHILMSTSDEGEHYKPIPYDEAGCIEDGSEYNSENNEEEENKTYLHDSDREQRLNARLQEIRQKYLEEVQKALDEYGFEREKQTVTATSIDPPEFEKMTNQKMEEELAKYGFRFTTRTSGISKLTRIWYALNEQNNGMTGIRQQTEPKVNNPIDFIRLKSKYYEDILIYVPIPLRGLFREMEEYGIKCSVTKLRQILTEQGVAFLDDSAI